MCVSWRFTRNPPARHHHTLNNSRPYSFRVNSFGIFDINVTTGVDLTLYKARKFNQRFIPHMRTMYPCNSISLRARRLFCLLFYSISIVYASLEFDSPIFYIYVYTHIHYILYTNLYILCMLGDIIPSRGTKVARFYDQVEAQSTGEMMESPRSPSSSCGENKEPK